MERERPPLGVLPQFIWREYRVRDILQSIRDYVDAGLMSDKVLEWEAELREHLEWLKEHRKKIENSSLNPLTL